ncbi:MAG: DNA photolyase family protein [Salinibacterium sp.]|nr:DNA photolyase family protein [Salinibacterium sp.]
MNTDTPTVVWLRDDLRLADNPALTAAVHRAQPIIVLYLLDEVSAEIRALGSASRWWLHQSLASLDAAITELGGTLTLRRGAAREAIPAIVAEAGAGAVYWNRRYGRSREIDADLKSSLRSGTSDGGGGSSGSGVSIDVQSFHASVLFEPWTVLNGQGEPYRVFAPFWRACLEHDVRAPLPAPAELRGTSIRSDALDDWALDDGPLGSARPDWAAGLREHWTPGEDGAHERLDAFVSERLVDYHRRDEPAVPATSRLSPHLRFGELSPFQVWERVQHHRGAGAGKNATKFLSEVGWREFSWNILYNFPELHQKNYRPAYDNFPWKKPAAATLRAWQEGRTGIPLVDAGMRELWHSGYMHNRVRMVVASFLIKNLLVDWRVGEAWFWDSLVDADEANNPASWQWVAGSGADAAPYFRVFNPQLQASKFDANNEYIRAWVPEFGTPEYPEAIVDLAESRQAALAAYEAVKVQTIAERAIKAEAGDHR